MRQSIWTFGVLLVCMTFGDRPAQGDLLPGNLLENPSIELDDDSDGIPDGWLMGGNDPSGDIWDSERPVSGDHHLLLNDTGTDNYTSWYTNVDLPVDLTELRFRWTWSYEFTSDNASDHFRMTVAWRSMGQDIGYNHVTVNESEPDYITEDQTFAVPEGTDALRLEFVTGGPQTETGRMWIDDISIVVPGAAVAGDFNQDGLLDASDIDLLSAKVRQGTNEAGFDLNADALVDDSDRLVWIDSIKKTYVGDADLNGQFDTTDFVMVFQAGQYEDGVTGNSGWATGDWNGDTEFDSSDFVSAFQSGGFEQGPRAAVSAVPEPAFGASAMGVTLLLLRTRKRIPSWARSRAA